MKQKIVKDEACETNEQKAFRYLQRCVDEYVVDLKSKKIIGDIHMHELASIVGMAIAEEREACVNAPARTLMQTANMLPHGWTMQIDLQKGAGGVSLFGPFDDLYEPDTGNGIEADMAQAVQFANFRNAEQETAVNGAWSRFVAAMGNDMPDSQKDEVSE